MLTMTAGRAKGQVVVGGPALEQPGDPTVETLPWCANHLFPSQGYIASSGGDCVGANGPYPSLGTLPNGFSWANASPVWHRDRRPAVMLQLASGGWEWNPRSLADWWWIDADNNKATLNDDVAVDVKKPSAQFDYIRPLVSDPQGNGIPDQFDALIYRMEYFRQQGFRRIILHNPAGVQGVKKAELIGPDVNGQYHWRYDGTNQSMNQFHGMPPWKQAYFKNPLGKWQEYIQQWASSNPDAEPNKLSIEVYIGGGLSPYACETIATSSTELNPDLSSQPHRVASCVGIDEVGLPEYRYLWSQPYNAQNFTPYGIHPSVAGHMLEFAQQVFPWVNHAGVYTIWLDAASCNTPTQAYRWGSLELAHNPYLRSHGIRLGGETVPDIYWIDQNGYHEVPDDCAIANMKWLANTQVVMRQPTNGPRYFKPEFNFNPRQYSEVLLFDNGSGLTWEECKTARQFGYVVSTYEGGASSSNPALANQVELIKHWYSMGSIRVADFDGNGTVNQTDYDMAEAAYQASMNHPNDVLFTVYATGDFDNNGMIDVFDWMHFQNYFYNLPTSSEPYGEAKGL